MDWQSPTDWSRETADGRYYLEHQSVSKARWWAYCGGKEIGKSPTEEGAKALCERHAVEAALSKRAQKLLARLRSGAYYPAYDANGVAGPKAMQELIAAGLAGTCGRAKVIEACYVPAGFVAGREAYPSHRHKKGGLYTKLMEALHSETKEPMVVYQGVSGDNWVRPMGMFNDPERFEPLEEGGGGGQGLDLLAKLREAEWLIREMAGHEGAEGFSDYLSKRLDAYKFMTKPLERSDG